MTNHLFSIGGPSSSSLVLLRVLALLALSAPALGYGGRLIGLKLDSVKSIPVAVVELDPDHGNYSTLATIPDGYCTASWSTASKTYEDYIYYVACGSGTANWLGVLRLNTEPAFNWTRLAQPFTNIEFDPQNFVLMGVSAKKSIAKMDLSTMTFSPKLAALPAACQGPKHMIRGSLTDWFQQTYSLLCSDADSTSPNVPTTIYHFQISDGQLTGSVKSAVPSLWWSSFNWQAESGGIAFVSFSGVNNPGPSSNGQLVRMGSWAGDMLSNTSYSHFPWGLTSCWSEDVIFVTCQRSAHVWGLDLVSTRSAWQQYDLHDPISDLRYFS